MPLLTLLSFVALPAMVLSAYLLDHMTLVQHLQVDLETMQVFQRSVANREFGAGQPLVSQASRLQDRCLVLRLGRNRQLQRRCYLSLVSARASRRDTGADIAG